MAAMVSVFKCGLAVFSLHENSTMGCFSQIYIVYISVKIDKKHQSQNAIRISERHFFFSNPGLTYFLLHFATQISFLLL